MYFKKSHFFKEGTLTVLGTPIYDPLKGNTSNNIQALQNTGQKNPDYFFSYTVKKNGELDFTRYLDLKSSQFKPMLGHIVIKSNIIEFNDSVKNLMDQQQGIFYNFGKEFEDISLFIINLMDNEKYTWMDKNIQLHEFYLKNMHRLTNGKTPSMIFYQEPTYEDVHLPDKRLGHIQANTDSCSSLSRTQDSIYNLLIGKYNIAKNYINSHGSCPSIRERIMSDFAENLSELCQSL